MQHQHEVGLRQELQLVGTEDDRLPLEEPRETLVEQMPALKITFPYTLYYFSKGGESGGGSSSAAVGWEEIDE